MALLDPPASTYGFVVDAWSFRTVCPRHFCCNSAWKDHRYSRAGVKTKGEEELKRGGGRCGSHLLHLSSVEEGGARHWYLHLQKSGPKDKALHP